MNFISIVDNWKRMKCGKPNHKPSSLLAEKAERDGKSLYQHIKNWKCIAGFPMGMRQNMSKPWWTSIHDFFPMGFSSPKDDTLWWTNIAMENHHFLWENPL